MTACGGQLQVCVWQASYCAPQFVAMQEVHALLVVSLHCDLQLLCMQSVKATSSADAVGQLATMHACWQSGTAISRPLPMEALPPQAW